METIVAVASLVVIIVAFLLRIERRLTKIETTLCWMKKEMEKCQPT